MKVPGMVTFATPRVPPRPDVVLAGFPEPPGLYLHVPFCTSICPFCPYNKVRYDAPLVERYFAALGRELDLYGAAATEPFGSIYIGGGTPTLCLDQLADLLTRIDAVGERAIEVLPNHMTEQLAERLVEIGITHVSIGAQSFDSQVLRHLRRPNTVAINRRALDVAIGRFECVDVDLMFDVGYQEPEVLLDDLRTCFDAGVDQVSTYPVMRFGYTPFGKADHDRRAEHAGSQGSDRAGGRTRLRAALGVDVQPDRWARLFVDHPRVLPGPRSRVGQLLGSNVRSQPLRDRGLHRAARAGRVADRPSGTAGPRAERRLLLVLAVLHGQRRPRPLPAAVRPTACTAHDRAGARCDRAGSNSAMARRR